MSQKIIRILEWVVPGLLLVAAGVVAWLNFNPSVWLTGWDTLHPEFDFGLNFGRLLSGVWRADQGVGALAAHSHMSEIPRLVVLWLLHLVIPVMSVRYVFVLLCLIIGPLGVYFFVRNGVFEHDNKGVLAGWLSGLIYLFNLYTVQHFIVPFEMFQVQYASIGWLFWLGLRAYRTSRLKEYGWLFLALVISSPQAYASQLWWVFAGCFGLFIVLTALFSGELFRRYKQVLIIFGLVFAANAFWLLPNVYFLIHGNTVPAKALINQLFSPDSFLKNREFGTMPNLVEMKNFLFDFDLYDAQQGFIPVMGQWVSWTQQLPVVIISWTAFALAIIGLIAFLLVRRQRSKPIVGAMVVLGLLAASALLTNTEPFRSLFDLLRSKSGLLQEGLRTPFTKVSIVYLLVYSVGFGLGGSWLITFLGNRLTKARLLVAALFVLLLSAGIIWSVKPMVQGKLIDNHLRLSIPESYFSLFDFMRSVPSSDRVALMPMLAKWGWEYHDWGYQGPGFLWFGLSQSVMTRDFDRWSPFNENFYRQSELAIARQDAVLFDSTMRQFNVNWLIVDNSLLNPGMDEESRRIKNTTASLLAQLRYQQVWSNGSLSVYDTGKHIDMVTSVHDWETVRIAGDYWQDDQVFASSSGYYITASDGVTNRLDARNGNPQLLKQMLIASEQWGDKRGFATATNCDRLRRGDVARTLLDSGRQYRAENGAAVCDYFDYPDIDPSQAYILHIQSRNVAGRSLKVSVNQFNSYRVVEEALLDSNQADNWLVIDGLVGNQKGLVVNVESRSYGEIASINSIEKIELYSIKQNEAILMNNQVDNLLVLNQGYDEGWIAFSGAKLLQHVKVNGWENGWITDDKHPTIIYWPQYLEWVGFGVLGLTVLLLVGKAVRKDQS